MRAAVLLLLLLPIAACAPSPRWAFDPHQEEGIHGNVEVEWWYHWGFLTDEAGNEWTAFSAFFRTWKKDLPITRYFLYDLTNLKTGTRTYRSAAGAEILPLVQALSGEAKLPAPHQVIPGKPLEKAGDPLRLQYGDDLLERTADGEYRLAVEVA